LAVTSNLYIFQLILSCKNVYIASRIIFVLDKFVDRGKCTCELLELNSGIAHY